MPPSASDPLTGDAARFRDDLVPLLGAGTGAGPGAPLLLAVSGGPDSMAMLALATEARIDLVVATVDHGLRQGSADEAAMVADHCAALGIAHATLRSSAAIAGASLQAQARDTRYRLLSAHAAAVGAAPILTAHHADDAAETLLMRAARGSGLAGLAGIRPRVVIAGTPVLRPLLGWRRAELRAIVRRREWPFVDDPANGDPRHDRSRFRRLLEANEWLDPPHLARAAAALAEADADVSAMVSLLWSERAETDAATVRLRVTGLPREILRRFARRAIAAVRAAAGMADPPWDASGNVEPLLDCLASGRGVTRAGVMASARQGEWIFRPAPPRRRHS